MSNKRWSSSINVFSMHSTFRFRFLFVTPISNCLIISRFSDNSSQGDLMACSKISERAILVSWIELIPSKDYSLPKSFMWLFHTTRGEEDEAGVNTPRWRKFLDSLNSIETPEKIVQRYRGFLKNDKYLDTRISVVTEWLKSLWMYADRLWSSDLLSLLFRCYNPESHKNQSEFME